MSENKDKNQDETIDNLNLYNQVREVPETAKKKIKGGRLAGKTDINPMWRIMTLTKHFGLCGIGWKTVIKRTWLDNGANGEITANVEIELFVKKNGEWSDGIIGIGGSSLISKEQNSLRTDDDCYKKAYTDAISVACKALGIGADVYWEKDSTKYDDSNDTEMQAIDKPKDKAKKYCCAICNKEISEKFYKGSMDKYGVSLCSAACKATFDKQKGEKE